MDLFKRVNSEAEACANVAYVLAQNGDLSQSQQMYLRALTLDNRMRAAAQAALQIKEREEARSRLASSPSTSSAVVPAVATEPVVREPMRLPNVGVGGTAASPVENRSS